MAIISDMDLIRAAHPATATGKPYNVVYNDGTPVVFHVRDRQEATRYAREYGIRMLHGARPVSIALLK